MTFFVVVYARPLNSSVYVMFPNMADNKIVIISFKTAYQIFQKLNLAEKRRSDQGTSDFEVIEDILHHERVELINFSDENLDPEKLVSSQLIFAILNISMVFVLKRQCGEVRSNQPLRL